ncbi:hypothetical protein D1007_39556 [Hordeum vulgare]|nr:hypothetical protein D1007_39556 [Hordeum vulgare]
MGIAKIHADGGLYKDRQVGAAAAVCRNDQGIYQGASAVVQAEMTDPEALEAQAICEAMALAIDLQFSRVLIISDCLSVIKNINLGNRMIAYGPILKEVDRRKDSFQMYPSADIAKGKMVISHQGKPITDQEENMNTNVLEERWLQPPRGWTKLNVDGAFNAENHIGGAGMILCGEGGHVIFSSCRYLRSCSSALEAELAACMEGIAIARAWSELPMIIETDCLTAARMIIQDGMNRSPCATMVTEIQRNLEEVGEHVISHVVRSRNKIADALAHIGHVKQRTTVWLRGIPEEVDTICKKDSFD